MASVIFLNLGVIFLHEILKVLFSVSFNRCFVVLCMDRLFTSTAINATEKWFCSVCFLAEVGGFQGLVRLFFVCLFVCLFSLGTIWAQCLEMKI